MVPGPLVVALGGNALQGLTGTKKSPHLVSAWEALAAHAGQGLIITHGNGPQIGMLAQYNSPELHFSMDILSAEVEGWLGYLIEQELSNRLGESPSVTTVITRVEVDPRDKAFTRPTKPVGPWLDGNEASTLATARDWTFIENEGMFRRLVPSPVPQKIIQLDAIADLLQRRHVVICAGGGGIPVIRNEHQQLQGIEAVIDKDSVSALLASQLQARLLVLATDVDGIYLDWDGPRREVITRTEPERLRAVKLPDGSMGPKATAACEFVENTGNPAVIGALDDLENLVQQLTGTRVLKPEDNRQASS